jgi:S-formylglutathione hydrolase FrmB
VRTPSLVDWRPNGPLPALGEITEIDIPATVSKFPHRKAYVYVPPAFKAVPRPTLPVLVMLVGTPGQPKNWLSAADADKTANAYAAAHFGLAPIMVMPDANGSFTGDTECADGPRGNAETYLAVDVPNWIRQEFSVPMDPTRWAVAGLSEGGTCAVMLALRYPETFGRFMTLSGDLRPNLGSRADTINSIYGGDASQWDAHDPLLIMARHRFGSTSGFFAAGTGESAKLTAARHLSEAAIAAGMDTELHVASGAQHNFLAWTAAFKVGLPWIASRLGLP